MGTPGIDEIQWINEILEQSPPVILLLGLLFVGHFIKKSPLNTSWILVILPIMGAITYPLIAELNKFRTDVKSPMLLLSIHGFLIGCAAVGANNMFRRVMERFFPMKNGNTERLVKTHERHKQENPEYREITKTPSDTDNYLKRRDSDAGSSGSKC